MTNLPPIIPTIQFVIPVPDHRPDQATLTQAFSPSLTRNASLIGMATHFPSDVFQLTPEGHKRTPMVRMSGGSPVAFHPQSPRAIRSVITPVFAPFTILTLGFEEEVSDYQDWLDAHLFPLTVVATEGGTFSYEEFSPEAAQPHFIEICVALEGQVDPEHLTAVRAAIESWERPALRHLDYQVKGHGSVIPNLRALDALGYDDLVSGPYEGLNPSIGDAPLIEQIVKTATTIRKEREEIGERVANRILRRPPDLNLYAPSILPFFFEMSASGSELSPEMQAEIRLVQRVLQRQSGYSFALTSKQAEKAFRIKDDGTESGPNPHPLLARRAAEVNLGTECVGALAASEISAVLRLPNDINRTSGQVRQFASQYRSTNVTERKRTEAFRRVQKRISDAVPSAFFELIRSSETGVRIISDAHLEWLDLDGLPLCLAKDTARIPVTPGNLFVEQVGATKQLNLTPSAFEEILIISALKREDPIKPFFNAAFETFGKLWAERIRVTEVEVSHEDELVDAINSFTGAMVIFDGHGSHAHNQPAQLQLMDRSVDVWHLFGRITRPPPIVILSACDTHAADRNHATTGNGFLSLGSRAVLASVFPLYAPHAAAFAARLVYRISDFLPAAFKTFKRSFTWLELVSGMIRMQALTDFLVLLTKRKLIDGDQYREIGVFGNEMINMGHHQPFDKIIEFTCDKLSQDVGEINRLFRASVAHSSVISYIHLGRPETILLHPEEGWPEADE